MRPSTARLRAVTGVKTLDTLQLVWAIGTGCKAFLTTDRELPPTAGLHSAFVLSRGQRTALTRGDMS
jgi:hypothetical protein